MNAENTHNDSKRSRSRPVARGSACAVEPVGVFIKDEMQERGWSIEELTARMDGDLTTQIAMELLIHAPTKGITLGENTASLLAKAFGTSKELWLRLDDQWQQHTPNAGDERREPKP